MDSLQQIITIANKTGRDFCAQGLITHRAETGTVRLRSDQRGWLCLEVWQQTLPVLRRSIAWWNCWLEGRQQVGQWEKVAGAEEQEVRFFKQAKKILGELEAVDGH